MHPGDIVAGKYRVSNILGRTNGYLLEARHTEFEQRVVIRLLSPHLCDKKELERFRREARTLSKLESEHVARIIDVGTHSDGSFYLVRQHLEGIDLATHLQNQGALTLEEAVLSTLQAAEALQECHSHNILLRELKPAHIFLTHRRGGTSMVKIIDFGTAKLLRDPAEVVGGEATATVMFGMSAYSSPELVRKNKRVDARTDVWSLGCVFYEMLAAVPPFLGDAAELMLRITRDDPIPLSQLRPDVPVELDQIVAWALAKDPASRFSSVYAMAHALKPFASPEGQVLIDRIGRLAHTKDSARTPPPQISPTSPLSRRTGSEPPPARAPEQTMLMAPGYDESEYEQTRYFGDDPFGPPPSSRRGSAPPSSRGSVPPPPASHPGGSGSWSALALDPDPLGSPYSTAGNTGGWPAPTAVGQQQTKRQHKAAVIAFGASLLLLPALVMVLVVTLRGQVGFSAPSPVAQSETKEQPATPGKVDPGEAAPATSGESPGEPPGEGTPSPSKQSARDDGNARFPVPPPKGGRFPPPPPPPRVAKAAPPPESEEPEPDESEGGGGEMGTLVAIAIGGDCAFAVDGASHGTRSSIRVKVPVGPHTVSCSPKGKSSRSQRVNVKAGKPGMATFRLN